MKMEFETPAELSLIAYEKLADHGFALPCYGQNCGANAHYVARSLHRSEAITVISCFEIYEPDTDNLIDLKSEYKLVRVGDPWIDVFIWRGEEFIGTKEEIWLKLERKVRDEIQRFAPLTLLNLLEGVPNVSTDNSARLAYVWLEDRFGIRFAVDWQIDTYLRGIAIRTVRRKIEKIDKSSAIRWALKDICLERGNSAITLQIPQSISEAVALEKSDFNELIRAADAFSINVEVSSRENKIENPSQALSAQKEEFLVLLRLRKGRGGTQTQIPLKMFDGVLRKNHEIVSGKTGKRHRMTLSRSNGRRNTLKLQLPELKEISEPVAKIVGGTSGNTLYLYDVNTDEGRRILSMLEEGRRDGRTLVSGNNPQNGTWWRTEGVK